MAGRSKGSEKRPWLAALLGTLATGLGHIYLRRWKRGLGWFVVAVVVSAILVPPEAARALLSGSGGDAATLAPLFAIGIASVADAYVLARMHQNDVANRDGAGSAVMSASGSESESGTGARSGVVEGGVAANRVPRSADVECPECGKELDPDLEFCPWCTVRLDGTNET
jgi:hypothetical protein